MSQGVRGEGGASVQIEQRGMPRAAFDSSIHLHVGDLIFQHVVGIFQCGAAEAARGEEASCGTAE